MKRVRFALLALCLLLGVAYAAAGAQAASAVPEALVGDWAGTASDGITLSFTVNPDGTGRYAFAQYGYEESADITLEAQSETFTAAIPAGNALGITACSGAYAYADGTLTLTIATTFATGRVFRYVATCQKTPAHTAAIASAGDAVALTVNTQAEADALYKQYAPLWNGKAVRLTIDGNADVFIPFLMRFSFGSLALDTSTLYTSTGIPVSQASGLTELSCDANSSFSSVPGLKRLTLRCGAVDTRLRVSGIGDMAPNLESLTLTFSSQKGYNFALYGEYSWPKSVQSLVITMDGQPALPQTVDMGCLIATLKTANPSATVNGTPVSTLDETQGLTDEDALQVRQSPFIYILSDLFRQMEANTLPVADGEPVFTGSLAIAVKYPDGQFETSQPSALAGTAFHMIPAGRLAVDAAAADTVILVYATHEKVGQYTNGMYAYGTATMVSVIDRRSGKVYAPYQGGYSSPPSVIKGFSGGRGDFLPGMALSEIAGKLSIE